jgi:hypothetical protein
MTRASWLAIFGLVAFGCTQDSRHGGTNGGVEMGLQFGDLAAVDGSAPPDLSGPMILGNDGGCGLQTCQSAGAMCGLIGDGCGNLLDCGPCGANESCVMGMCVVGMGMCTPKSCADQGFTCGAAGDTCGNIINCGSCMAPKICGGGGTANVCGVSCTNLCTQQVVCDMGSTTISGTVLAPTDSSKGYGNPDPLANALVYIPNGTVQPFTKGVSCDACGAQVTGSPLVSVLSGVDGTFVLPNAPCGTNIPLIIQLGRWRRHITIPSVACCDNTALTGEQTRFPRQQNEGGDPLNNIPLIAVQTGAVDPIECILPKIGIDVAGFSNPGGTGRVHLFQGTGCYLQGRNIVTAASGARIDAATPLAENALWPSAGTLGNYDAIIADCVDCQIDQFSNKVVTNATKKNVRDYLNAGGRLFASHFSYVWLYNNAPLSTTAAWNVQQCWSGAGNNNCFPADTTGFSALVDNSFTDGKLFADWLNGIGAATSGLFTAYQVRHDLNSVTAPSERFISVDPASTAAKNWAGIPLEYTFNTPVGGANQCGRVVFSDFHVNTNGMCNGTCTFPAECGAAAPMTAQEKVLEYMLFNLTSCVPPTMQGCTPTTCMALGYNCGAAGNGCGGILQCGNCPPGETCGAQMPNVCGTGTVMCTPATCQSLGFNCGAAGDGCGGILQCGTCPTGQTCGGGGVANVCGAVG